MIAVNVAKPAEEEMRMKTGSGGRGWLCPGALALAAALAGCQGSAEGEAHVDVGVDVDVDVDAVVGPIGSTEAALRSGRHGHRGKCRREQDGVSAALRVPGAACLKARARGWGEQIYTCSGGAWVLKAPEA